MNANEKELLEMIKNSTDPEAALLTAMRIITEFLEKENTK